MKSKLFTKTDKSIGNSYILGCTFWETKKPNVFLTDYDFRYHRSLIGSDLYLLFYNDGKVTSCQFVSSDFLNLSEHIIEQSIEKIYNESIKFKLNKN